MTDYLSADDTAAFLDAMRDIADTFGKYTIVLDGVPVSCSRKDVKNEVLAQEEGNDIDQAFKIILNRQFLAELGLVDGDGTLLFDYDSSVEMDGEEFTITGIGEPVFRDTKVSVVLEIVR